MWFRSSGFPRGQERDGPALLLSWKWTAGVRQKLIKLVLAKDTNCGITPWTASNPISPAQLVTRSWDEFLPATKHSSWTSTRKSIHQTLRFSRWFDWFFIKGPAFPVGQLPAFFHLNFDCVTLKSQEIKSAQLEFNMVRRSAQAWHKEVRRKSIWVFWGEITVLTNGYCQNFLHWWQYFTYLTFLPVL